MFRRWVEMCVPGNHGAAWFAFDRQAAEGAPARLLPCSSREEAFAECRRRNAAEDVRERSSAACQPPNE